MSKVTSLGLIFNAFLGDYVVLIVNYIPLIFYIHVLMLKMAFGSNTSEKQWKLEHWSLPEAVHMSSTRPLTLLDIIKEKNNKNNKGGEIM